MVGVGENDLGSGVVNLCRGHRLEGAMSADGHEDRRFDYSVWSCNASATGAGSLVFGEQFKFQHDIFGFSGADGAKCCLYMLQATPIE